jgi:2-amino-4-hydroxy-6-hydroxymethyldihydropteridine diphosphokinase
VAPDKNIGLARRIIAKDHHLTAESAFVRTTPIGLRDQPDFTNGVFLVSTRMGRQEFRSYLKEVETALGRVRKGHKYGPRSIDLDIVVWNGTIVDEDYHSRAFLREAVQEVLPGLRVEASEDN